MTNRSTLAPSEKHLEDWIAANLNGFDYLDGLIARQVHCKDGIIDLIGFKEHRLQVVELKKGEIDSKALTQLLRYMKDVRSVFDAVGMEMHYIKGIASQCYGFSYEGAQFIQGQLVGRSIDEKIFLACYEAGVQVVLYSFENGNYNFDTARIEGLYDEDLSPEVQQLRPLFEQFILAYEQRFQKEIAS